jgi:UDP-N-acetylmuramate--alanine ligase
MNLNNIHSVYFVGIGGIGMSALARFFNEKKVRVSGYDKTPTPLTEQLIKEGIQIHFSEDVTLIDLNPDLVIYTPAIPASHQELVWYQTQGFKVVKRSDVLQYISEQMQSVCVAGTHGKTTISTLVAHLLRHTEYGCNAFLGGISSNYGVNYWSSDTNHAVIEADEYDRSFLKLIPEIAIVTAMDPDHLDIYGTTEEMERCYLQFITQVSDTLIYKHGLSRSKEFAAPNKYSYSLQNDAASYYASDIIMKNGTYHFTFCKEGNSIVDVDLNIGGMHNVENTVAAMAVCDRLGLDMINVSNAVAAFKGVKRRFEYIVKSEHQVYIDDYAHHPEELRMLISSAKALFKGRKVSVVFQPHLFTRTRDFADGFAESLDLADEVILLDIYPARELPIEGVNSQMLLDRMSLTNKNILSKEGVLQWVKASKIEVLITAGAGDIDTLVNPIKQLLTQD